MNQNPEQLARDEIDRQLLATGWVIQNKKTFNLSANIGVAIRELQTSVGPADYVLFVNQKPVVLIEAKRQKEGVHLTMVEDQSTEYAWSERHKSKTKIQFSRALDIFENNLSAWLRQAFVRKNRSDESLLAPY